MADLEQLPTEVAERVQALGVPVTSEEVDTYRRYRETEDRSFRLGPVPILVEKGMAYSPESHGKKT